MNKKLGNGVKLRPETVYIPFDKTSITMCFMTWTFYPSIKYLILHKLLSPVKKNRKI